MRCLAVLPFVLAAIALLLGVGRGWIQGLFATPQPQAPSRPEISVPFYVHENEIITEMWNRCNFTSEKVKKWSYHHASEIYFHHQIQNHPWRVRDPREALIFVVSVPWTFYLRNQDCFPDAPKRLALSLEITPEWQRHGGADHLTASTDYQHSRTKNIFIRRLLKEMTVATKGILRGTYWRCSVMSGYTVSPYLHKTLPFLLEDANDPPWRLPSTPDVIPFTLLPLIEDQGSIPLHPIPWADRKFNFVFQGQTNKRVYKLRLLAMSRLKGHFSPSVLVASNSKPSGHERCGDVNDSPDALENCTDADRDGQHHATFAKRLGNSKLSLHLPGDDYHSARFHDSIAAGTPLVVLADLLWERGMANDCQVPWQSMLVGLKQSEFTEDPVGSMQNIFDAYIITGVNETAKKGVERRTNSPGGSPKSMEEILRLMKLHARDVLWEAPASRMISNILFNTARRCLPLEILQEKGAESLHWANYRCPHEVFTLTMMP